MIIAASLLMMAAPVQDTTDFHQAIDYRIEARLDESTDVLTARARLIYTNRSPATLDTLWFHQHLNAFRPNSAWARRELEYGERRFQDLGPEEHAFERLTAVRVGDRPVEPVYPLAPDSTVVGIPLPAPLAPGQTVTVMLDWDARLATLPRRQGREGRHFDFAQWYPRIATYDQGGWRTQPLMPQGEFYGEFAAYDVTLDVMADQVIGATGVPVEGDPGWRAAAAPGHAAGASAHDAAAATAPAAEPLGLLTGDAAAGRKRVRWTADDVHHFAWSTDPEYIYESGSVARAGVTGEPIAIHVLYQPGDDDWDDGVAVQRTVDALDWLQELFGPYPWPQLTNLHRIEGGGTEFPMVIMDGSADEGLIVHEVTHQYAHGILANNEWKDGWLDEGFTSFITSWYFEDKGQTGMWERGMEVIRESDRTGRSQPVAWAGADFRNPATYSAMTYTKASLIFRMLREMVGADTMRAILREYYDRNRLRHVDEEDFAEAAEAVAGRDLGWFFQQWLHTTDTLDYAIGGAETERMADGRWRTTVTVLRLGGAWMPVELQVGSEVRTLESRDRRQVVTVVTGSRPSEVVLDPRDVLIDIDPGNNRQGV
jgi:hypothetical protein